MDLWRAGEIGRFDSEKTAFFFEIVCFAIWLVLTWYRLSICALVVHDCWPMMMFCRVHALCTYILVL